jgi:hypothetical protein
VYFPGTRILSLENGVHTFEGTRENRNEEAPTEEEVNSAIKQLKSNKATGFDNINSETLKAGGRILSRWIHRMINKIWESEDIPEDWIRAIFVIIQKFIIHYSRREARVSATTGEA